MRVVSSRDDAERHNASHLDAHCDHDSSIDAFGPPPKGGGNLHLGLRPRLELFVLLLAILAFLAAMIASGRWAQGSTLRRLPVHLRSVALVAMLVLFAIQMGCNDYYAQLNLQPANQTGTPTGNYTIVLNGTLGNNSGVTRQTTVLLSVSP